MARKKKLNKRAVVFIGIAAAVLTIVIGIVIVYKLPKDPEAAIRNAEAAVASKDYSKANRYFAEAIKESEDAHTPSAVYYKKMAKLHLDLLKSPILNQTEIREHYNAARVALQSALRVDTTDIESHHLLCDLIWNFDATLGKQWKTYVDYANALLRYDPTDHATLFRRGVARSEIFRQNGDDENRQAALADILKAIELKKDEVTYWQMLAALYIQMKNPAAAEKAYADAMAAIPDNAQLHVMFADYLLGQNKPDEAMKQLQEACRIAPSDPSGRLAIARLYINQGKFAEAQGAYEEAIKIDPGEYRSYRDLAADIYLRQGKYDEAVIVLRDGLKALSNTDSAPASQDASLQRAKLEFGRAELNYALANSLLTLAERNPEQSKGYIQQAKACLDGLSGYGNNVGLASAKINGKIAILEGRYDDAAGKLEPFYDPANPTDPQIGYMLIQIYQANRTPGKAEAVIRHLLEMPTEARNPFLHYRLAQILLQRNDVEEAKKELGLALSYQSDYQPAIEVLTLLRAAETGQVPKNIASDQAVALLDYARQKVMSNQTDEGLKITKDVLVQRADDPRVAMAAAGVYVAAKQEDQAKAVLEKALEKNPNDPQLKQAVELLSEPDLKKRQEMQLEAMDSTISEPIDRALAKAQRCMAGGDEAGYAKYLAEAAAIDPENKIVIDWQFHQVLSKAKDNANWEADARKLAAKSKDPLMSKIYASQIAIVKEDYPAAATALIEALKQKDNKGLRSQLGDVYAMMNELTKAQETYKAVLALDPGYPQALVGMAKITAKLSPGPEHDRYVEQAYQMVPNEPYIKREYLRAQQSKVSPEKAIEVREELRKQEGDDAENLLQLAMLYERVKKLDKAEALYLEVYDKAPDKINAARQLLKFYVRTNNQAEIGKLQNTIMDKEKFTDQVASLILYGESCLWQGTEYQKARARKAFEQAIEKAPKDPRGYKAMANLELSENQAPAAVEMMQKYCDLMQSGDLTPVEKALAQKELAKAMVEAGKYDEAIAILKRILAQEPNDPQALSDEAIILMRQDKMDEAEKLLNGAVNSNPTLVDPLILRASLYAGKANIAKAEADLEAAKKLSSQPEKLRGIASIYARMGKNEKAEQVYTDILSRDTENTAVMYELAKLYLNQPTPDYTHLDVLLEQAEKKATQKVTFYQIEADSWKRRGVTDKYLKALEQAYTLAPDMTTTVAYVSALIDGGQGQIGKVDPILQGVSDKDAPWVKALKARCLVKQKQAGADEAFKSLLETCPGDDLPFVLEQMEKAYGAKDGIAKIDAWKINRGEDWLYCMRLSDWCAASGVPDALKRSKELLDKALTLAKQPEQKAETEFKLGTIYHQENNFSEAQRCYLSSLTVLPDNVQCLNNLAYLYTNDLGKAAEALQYAKKASRLAPTNSDVLDTYGWTLMKLNQLNEALPILQQAVEAEQPAPVCRYHLGLLYEQQSNYEYARNCFKAGLEMLGGKKDDPLYKQCQNALDRIAGK